MSQSNVPAISFTDTGPVIPETDAVLSSVREDWKGALGQKLDTADDTPQGQLITSETAIIDDKNTEVLTVCNMFNPETSSGVWQDALAKIYFIDRKPALPTREPCVCVGLAGTRVPVTGFAQAESGHLFRPVQAFTIPATGQITVEFECLETGAIAAPAGTIATIYKAIPGWDSITNLGTGTIGRPVETRLEFEQRRRESVSKNGKGSVQAIYGEIMDQEGVIDAVVEENTEDDPVVIGGVTIAGHSIFAVADGGTDADIAAAIFAKKSAGCGMVGNTEVTHYWLDTEGESVPYTVRFNRNDDLPVKVQVIIVVTSETPADIETRIKEAVVANFYGLSENCCTQGRVRIKRLSLYASRFYGSVVLAGVSDVVSVKVDTVGGTGWRDLVEWRLDQKPVLTAENVEVVSTTRAEIERA